VLQRELQIARRFQEHKKASPHIGHSWWSISQRETQYHFPVVRIRTGVIPSKHRENGRRVQMRGIPHYEGICPISKVAREGHFEHVHLPATFAIRRCSAPSNLSMRCSDRSRFRRRGRWGRHEFSFVPAKEERLGDCGSSPTLRRCHPRPPTSRRRQRIHCRQWSIPVRQGARHTPFPDG